MNIEEVFRRYIKKKKLVDSQQSSKMRNDKRKSSDKFCSKLDELVFSLDEDITTDEFDADEKDFSVKEDYVLNCLRSYCKVN